MWRSPWSSSWSAGVVIAPPPRWIPSYLCLLGLAPGAVTVGVVTKCTKESVRRCCTGIMVLVCLPIINVLGRRLAELEMYSMLAHIRKERFFYLNTLCFIIFLPLLVLCRSSRGSRCPLDRHRSRPRQRQ